MSQEWIDLDLESNSQLFSPCHSANLLYMQMYDRENLWGITLASSYGTYTLLKTTINY